MYQPTLRNRGPPGKSEQVLPPFFLSFSKYLSLIDMMSHIKTKMCWYHVRSNHDTRSMKCAACTQGELEPQGATPSIRGEGHKGILSLGILPSTTNDVQGRPIGAYSHNGLLNPLVLL